LGKKRKKITGGRKAGRSSKTEPPPPLTQGLDPPLGIIQSGKKKL